MKRKLDIIIVSYNIKDILIRCLNTIYETCNGIDYKIIVVDNNSCDFTATEVRSRFPEIQVIENEKNMGFASANNKGYAVSKSEFILLLNPDTILKKGSIREVINFMNKSPDAGLSACRLLNAYHTLQKSIMNLPSIHEYLSRALFIDRILFDRHKASTYYREKPFTIGMPSGAFMMIRRSALDGEVIFKETSFLYAEEPDICMRLWKRGWKVYFVPSAEIIHYGGESTKKNEFKSNIELQRSIKHLFTVHWHGLKRLMINIAYWSSLVTSTIASLIDILSPKGIRRYYQFFSAAILYPILKSEKNHE